jgi:hypothetical protein
MVLDTTWYRGSWWDFAEDAFGVDDSRWVDASMIDEDGNFLTSELMEYINGEWVPIEGAGPFWNEGGEYWGHDWLWRGADGEIFAYTDREFFVYHFPTMLQDYIKDVKKNIGFQKETSLVLGIDAYHYTENWWVHAWGNYLPLHYGHDKYAYHNADGYQQHLEDGKEPYAFEFIEPGIVAWNDYDFGGIFGVKLQDNLGVFAEGRYLFYWERPAYDLKFGLNYQFMGF